MTKARTSDTEPKSLRRGVAFTESSSMGMEGYSISAGRTFSMSRNEQRPAGLEEACRTLDDQRDEGGAAEAVLDAAGHERADAVPKAFPAGHALDDGASVGIERLVAAPGEMIVVAKIGRDVLGHAGRVLEGRVIPVVGESVFGAAPVPGRQDGHALELGVIPDGRKEVATRLEVRKAKRGVKGHESGVMKLVDRVIEELAGMPLEVTRRAVERRVRRKGHADIVAEGQKEAALEAETGRKIAQRVLDPMRIVEQRSREESQALAASRDAAGPVRGRGEEGVDQRPRRILGDVVIEIPGVGQEVDRGRLESELVDEAPVARPE